MSARINDELAPTYEQLLAENASQRDWINKCSELWDAGCDLDNLLALIPETPTTDAAIAEIKAQGLDELANACDGYAENHVYTFTKRHAEEFAIELREAK